MPIAGNITTKTVTGNYVDYAGNAIAGQLIFTVNERLRNAVANQILIPSSKYVTLDGTGSFSTTLITTNDPDFHDDFTYEVEEAFANGKTYTITLTEASPATQDISDLRPEDSGYELFFTPIAAGQWSQLVSLVDVEETYWGQSPNRVGRTVQDYDYLHAIYNSYAALAADNADYGALTVAPLRITVAELQALLDRLTALIAYNHAENATTLPATLKYLPAKYQTNAGLAAAFASYSQLQAIAQIALTGPEVGIIVNDSRRALGQLGTGSITHAAIAELDTRLDNYQFINDLMLMGV